MTQPAYRLLRDRFAHKAGTIVYDQRLHDYGLASTDTRQTGIEHTTVTLNENGDYPGFTVPVCDLQPLPAGAPAQPLLIPLPRYRCHKEVSALKIKHIVGVSAGFEMHFEGDRIVPQVAPSTWVHQHCKGDPQNLVGGYLVVYEDGYRSWSPAKAFEEGYTLIEGAPAPLVQPSEPGQSPEPACKTSASADDDIEAEIQAKDLTAPRVTPADVEANIASERYFTAANGVAAAGGVVYSDDDGLRCLTFCVLVLRNGFTVTGQSACASPENFDAELGRKIARQDAVRQVWPLMGYALRERLAAAPSIPLTPTEVQSGMDRVRWAEGLIRQLPEDHDGRNSWLLNYGSDAATRRAEWSKRNPNSSLGEAMAAPSVGERPPAKLYDEVRAEAVKAGVTDDKMLHALGMMPFTSDLRGIGAPSVSATVAIARKFIDDNRVSCPEATTNDCVYENAPELVAQLAEVVGYFKHPEA